MYEFPVDAGRDLRNGRSTRHTSRAGHQDDDGPRGQPEQQKLYERQDEEDEPASQDRQQRQPRKQPEP